MQYSNKNNCTKLSMNVSVCVCGWGCACTQRPVAMQCLRQMQEPSFACLRYMLSCDSHSQLFLSQLQGYSAVFWSRDKEDRFVWTLNLLKNHLVGSIGKLTKAHWSEELTLERTSAWWELKTENDAKITVNVLEKKCILFCCSNFYLI